MAVVMAIFLADSILFNLEFKLAKVSFFLPTASYFWDASGFAGSFLMGSAGGGGGVGASEFMKLFNFFSRSALSFVFSNLGTGGGLLGRSIYKYAV